MTTRVPPPEPPDVAEEEERPGVLSRAWRAIIGPSRDLADPSLFRHLSLIPFLAWVGLGADGLSSSAYGPEELYNTLGANRFLAVFLALATAATVILIATAYSRIIDEFPHGGGGYLVATKLLGPRTGVVSGCALLVDYVLTIAVSLAAACDSVFSFLPVEWQLYKLPLEVVLVVGLTTLNIRGVKESVLALAPIFVLFLITHVLLIGGGVLVSLGGLPHLVQQVTTGVHEGSHSLGWIGLFLVAAHAYSMGAGTYTGLEAVSNGLPIMREPRVRTAKRTMLYMALSLSLTAGGLIFCYLLRDVQAAPGKTLNAVLLEGLHGELFFAGHAFTIVTLLSAGLLLVVGAQAGFLDGPRVLASMAVDSWMPRRFASLSERLTTQNGYILMGLASLAALVYTRGNVRALVVMYSINVFVTFSLSMLGMLKLWVTSPGRPGRTRHVVLFLVGFVVCLGILGITVVEKFEEGGWVTLVVTGAVVAISFEINRHYRGVGAKLAELDRILDTLPLAGPANGAEPDPNQHTAIVMVGGYGGLGIHTILNIHRTFPRYFKSFVFVSVAVVDSGAFKGEGEIDHLRDRTADDLQKYVDLARRMGFAAASRYGVGTDLIDAAEEVAVAAVREFPKSVFFAGKVIFRRERWYTKFLHNQMAYSVQRRLQWRGMPMVIVPVRVS